MAAEVTSCPGCDAPVLPDQRYCLNCGGQVGERRLDPLALLRARRGTEAAPAGPPQAPELPEVASERHRWSPRTLGASCLGLLLGGALIGAAFAPGPTGSLAAAAGQVIVVSSPAGADAGGGGTGAPTASFAPSEDPVPAPAAPTPAPAPAPAPVAPAAAPPAPAPEPKPAPQPEPPAPEKPSIGHVYLVVLPANTDAQAVLDPYLDRGELLTGFKPASDDPGVNRIALVSGQDTGEEFPPDVKTLADQLSTWGFDWRAYVEGMEQPCRHPDPLDPFASFHSVIDRADCSQHLLPLDQFDPKPMFSFIAPLSADALQSWVDPILASKPYKKDGLLVVMFDNAPQALVLSQFVERGSTNDTPYDGYSVLKTIEDRIGLGEHLGHADDKQVHAFGKDVFDRELDPYQDPEGL